MKYITILLMSMFIYKPSMAKESNIPHDVLPAMILNFSLIGADSDLQYRCENKLQKAELIIGQYLLSDPNSYPYSDNLNGISVTRNADHDLEGDLFFACKNIYIVYDQYNNYKYYSYYSPNVQMSVHLKVLCDTRPLHEQHMISLQRFCRNNTAHEPCYERSILEEFKKIKKSKVIRYGFNKTCDP